MRLDPPLKITAAEVWLPDKRESAESAGRAGKVEPQRVTVNGYTGLAVSDIPPPHMAVHAAERALTGAAVSRDEVGLLIHASAYYQGQDYWEPVHFIVNELSLYSAAPLGVSLGCNGGFAAIEVAACRILADDVRTVVITSAERFCLPRFDRWRANLDVFYGDSGTALIIDTERGPMELLSTANVTDPRLEWVYRGSLPWNSVPFEHAPAVDIRTQLRNFIASGHGPQFRITASEAITRAVRTALDLAGVAANDPRIKMIVPPRFGAELILHSYTEPLAGCTKADVVNLGLQTGHLGAGDTAANIADIMRGKMLEPGQIALLLTATAGFSWSCLVVRMC